MIASIKESSVDVLVIGAGPTGLMAGIYLSQLGVNARIIDKRGTRALNGRADVLQSRTMEIWESFDLSDRAIRHGNTISQMAVWSPRGDGKLKRVMRSTFNPPGITRLPVVSMHQGNVESFMIDKLESLEGVQIQRGAYPTTLDIDETKIDEVDAHPIAIRVKHSNFDEIDGWHTNAHLKHSDGSMQRQRGFISDPTGRYADDVTYKSNGLESTEEIVHAKYVYDGSGGNSWARNQLGISMEGSTVEEYWCVMDILPITDWPDVRKLCTISGNDRVVGSVPRERGMIRLDVQLDGPMDPKSPDTAAKVLELAKVAFAPYKMDYKYCDWCSVYKTGQRVSNKYSHLNRVFLGGDAVHLHTPKEGQGINTSMQDSYNFAWKVAGVVKGCLSPSVLSTYESERRPLGQELVAIDRAITQSLTATRAMDFETVQRLGRFAAGPFNAYAEGILVDSSSRQHLAKGLVVGTRFPTCMPVFRQSDGVRVELQSVMKSDGRWRLVVFIGDSSEEREHQRVAYLASKLHLSLTKRYKSLCEGKSFLDVMQVRPGALEDFELGTDSVLPYSENRGYGLDREFTASSKMAPVESNCFDKFEIDRSQGCMLVVRPDGYISWLGELDDDEGLEEYFARFMI